MATDSSVAITAGAGTPIDVITLANGDHQQVVRHAATNAAPAAPTSWTVTTAGLSNVVAADQTRVSVIITSNASARVWLRFDATIPTAALHSVYIDPDQIMTLGQEWATRAISAAGQTAGGTVLFTLGATT